MEENLHDKLKIQSWENAFHTFGYEYIFSKRAQRYSKWVNWLKVFGILVPAVIGATALGYGINNSLLKQMITLAIPTLIIQFSFSVLAIIYNWDDELSYSFEASQSYNNLYRRFKNLAQFSPTEYYSFSKEYDLLDTEYNGRNQQDSKHNIREWELRKGMKFSLREFKKKCIGCDQIPISIESTHCPVCGNFSLKYQYKIFRLWQTK